jgi:hypothetical protein
MTPTAGARASDEPAQGGHETMGGGNATSQAGAKASQGGSDTSAAATCDGVPPYCLLSCRSLEGATLAECVDHRYVCPAGSLTFEGCSDDACIKRTDNCCSATGRRTVPDCAADGTIGQCPEGYEVPTGACLPQGVDIQDCSEIKGGELCTDPELVCYTSKCGRNCFCMPDDGPSLRWICRSLPC